MIILTTPRSLTIPFWTKKRKKAKEPERITITITTTNETTYEDMPLNEDKATQTDEFQFERQQVYGPSYGRISSATSGFMRVFVPSPRWAVNIDMGPMDRDTQQSLVLNPACRIY
jgi:hypothetical protein